MISPAISTLVSAAQTRPRLVVTAGDPAGIGTEVILKALADPDLWDWVTRDELTVVGNRALLQQTYDQLVKQQPQLATSLIHPDALKILEVPLAGSLLEQIELGKESAASGEASFQFLQMAVAQTLAGQFQGVVTAPIAKSAWKAAGHFYPGQTELLAEMAGAKRFGMLFVAQSPHTGWTLRTLLATTHIPLRQVPDALTPDLLTLKLELLIDCLRRDFGLTQPRIAIAGLNPHSGEQGQLGDEEQTWLTDWLQTMRQKFPEAVLQGPVPPDTLWVRPGQAWFGGSNSSSGSDINSSTNGSTAHDAYLALYHDQGLIPVKLMAFDRAVNTTIGLPFVRTSPDHGTAFDIAGQGIASPESFKAAVQVAAQLAQVRAV